MYKAFELGISSKRKSRNVEKGRSIGPQHQENAAALCFDVSERKEYSVIWNSG